MRIEQLNFILEIHRQNSMKSAAKQLHITPQALSSTIKSLEDELNIQIFHRSNKGISLTEDGKLIAEFADTTITNYNHMLKKLGGRNKILTSLKGSLSLYVAPVFLESILPVYINKFKQDYPNISIEIIERNTLTIASLLQTRSSDSTVGALLLPYDGEKIIPMYLPPNREDFSYKILNRNYYCACVPKDFPHADQKSISIKKLLDYPLVDYCAGSAGSAPLIPLLQQYQPKFKTALTLSSISLWAEAIQNHMGIGILNTLFTRPDSIVSKQLDNLLLIKLKEPLITFNCFAYSRTPSPSVTAFLQQFPPYVPKKTDPDIHLEN